jgi:hypothetical protein
MTGTAVLAASLVVSGDVSVVLLVVATSAASWVVAKSYASHVVPPH